jgi:hypothetical protein
MTRQLELPLETEGEGRQSRRRGEAPTAATGTERSGASGLMERVLARPNLLAALKRVRKNKGSPGIDGMTVDDLPDWLREHWVRTRGELLAGTYRPQPVQRQLIPKTGGGKRALGIPTVLDRLIQQALLQVLQPQLQCLRAVGAGRATGDAASSEAVRQTPPSGQRGEERGGTGADPFFPGLLLVGSSGAAGKTQGVAQGP